MPGPVNPLVGFVFFGNYFYSFCAIALSIEAALQQYKGLNSWMYYVMLFCAVVLYYTHAYISTGVTKHHHQRSQWYISHRKLIRSTQISLTVILLAVAVAYGARYGDSIFRMSYPAWFVLLVFPFMAALYYGIGYRVFVRYSLRSIGWIKPFVIGAIWAAVVTIYPIIFHDLQHGNEFKFTSLTMVLYIKNMMFISVLCIMFDIKDYADDYNQRLKTFVTRFGLRKTIFYILIPLSLLGLTAFILYGIHREFSAMKMFLNVLPFIALLVVAQSVRRRKSIFYYLVIIDGLMLFKAVCGSIAMAYF